MTYYSISEANLSLKDLSTDDDHSSLALEHVQTYKLPSDESFSNALVDQTLDVETTFGHDDISLLHTLSEQRSYCDKNQQVPYGSSCCIDKFEIDFLLAWWC